MKCGDLAKDARPAYLGDFYRRIAVRYVFMAEEILNEARRRGEIADEADRRAAPLHTIATSSERRGAAVPGLSGATEERGSAAREGTAAEAPRSEREAR